MAPEKAEGLSLAGEESTTLPGRGEDLKGERWGEAPGDESCFCAKQKQAGLRFWVSHNRGEIKWYACMKIFPLIGQSPPPHSR